MRRSPLEFMRAARDQYGDVVRIPSIWPIDWYLFSHPSHVEHVLSRALHPYPKGYFGSIVRIASGRGLIALDGADWQRERHLIQPLFHRQPVRALAPVMVEASERCASRVEAAAASGQPVDIGAEMVRLVLDITGRTLFGRDLSPYADRVTLAMRASLEEIHARLMYPLSARVPWPTRERRRRLAAGQDLDRLARDLVEDRRRDGGGGDDLLGLLLRERHARHGLTDEAVVGETRNFLVGSYETSAVTLTWCWLMLATHADADARLQDELARVLGDRQPTADDVDRLPYLRMVIEETLRLYPPAPYFGRVAQEADEVGGYHIPAGSIVTMSAWLVHRHPDFWESPDVFDPERFGPARARPPRGAYFPFGSGPRQCIGGYFGMVEMALALATMARRVRLRLAPGHRAERELLGTLHPRPGILMTAALRTTPGDAPVYTPAAWK
jgi:cytochrome P450